MTTLMGEREVQMMRMIGMMMIVTRMTIIWIRMAQVHNYFFLKQETSLQGETNSTIIIDECENDGDCTTLH